MLITRQGSFSSKRLITPTLASLFFLNTSEAQVNRLFNSSMFNPSSLSLSNMSNTSQGPFSLRYPFTCFTPAICASFELVLLEFPAWFCLATVCNRASNTRTGTLLFCSKREKRLSIQSKVSLRSPNLMTFQNSLSVSDSLGWENILVTRSLRGSLQWLRALMRLRMMFCWRQGKFLSMINKYSYSLKDLIIRLFIVGWMGVFESKVFCETVTPQNHYLFNLMQESNPSPPQHSTSSGNTHHQESFNPYPSSDIVLSQPQSPHNPFATLTYFQTLRVMLNQNKLFFFHQFLTGNFVKQVFKKLGLACLCDYQRNSPDLVDSMFLKLYLKITPRSLPNLLRPFLCGLFIPMLVLFYLNYQYVNRELQVDPVVLKIINIFFIITIALYIVTGFITGGSMNTDIWRYRSTSICAQKPWIKTEKIYCIDCKIIKPLRSYHCKYCRVCTPKYSKHSIVFNQCIGANNQLIYMVFQGVFFILISIILALFVSPKQPLFHSFKVFIIRFIFFLVNSYLQGMAGFQFLRELLYIITYNCTEYEVSNWSSKSYLCTFDQRRFYNPFQSTICRHIIGSLYGLFGCSDEDTENRVDNWAKTYYYYPSHVRGHAEYMQLVLYSQQREEREKERHGKILKQLEILGRMEDIGRRGMEDLELIQYGRKSSEGEEGKEVKDEKMGNMRGGGSGVRFKRMGSSDDMHLTTDNDCPRTEQLLSNQRMNKTLA